MFGEEDLGMVNNPGSIAFPAVAGVLSRVWETKEERIARLLVETSWRNWPPQSDIAVRFSED